MTSRVDITKRVHVSLYGEDTRRLLESILNFSAAAFSRHSWRHEREEGEVEGGGKKKNGGALRCVLHRLDDLARKRRG